MAKAKAEKKDESRKARKKAQRREMAEGSVYPAAAPLDSAAVLAGSGDEGARDESVADAGGAPWATEAPPIEEPRSEAPRTATATPKVLRRVRKSAELAARAAARLVEATDELERLLSAAPLQRGKRRKT